MNNIQSDVLRTTTPDQHITGDFVDADMESNNSYEDDLFCEATPVGPLKLKQIGPGQNRDDLHIFQDEGLIKNVPALEATPTGATPHKQGLSGTM